MKIIFDYNRTIFDPETNDLYVGVFDLLEKLKVEYNLYLVSRNEPARIVRFKEFDIEKFFTNVYFVEEKTIELFQTIAELDTQVMVIGDYIQEEISIGNQLDFITVRVRQGRFKDVIPSHDNEKADYEIETLAGLENILNFYEQ